VIANGLPADLIPAALRTVVVDDDHDAENELRTAVLEFADVVRMAESAIASARATSVDLKQSPLTAEEWRAKWP
jgi:XTP/dITP diphosphohydrolase